MPADFCEEVSVVPKYLLEDCMEIDELKSMIGRPEGDWVADFEIAAEAYYQQHGDASLRPLMGLLGDDLHEDINFAIIHIIEQSESDRYVRALINLVIERGGSAGYWLDVLHFRVFNSAPDLRAYAQILRSFSAAGKASVSRYLSTLAQDPKNAKFLPQINILQSICATD